MEVDCIKKELMNNRKVLLVLIDPEKTPLRVNVAKIAKTSEPWATAILVGGSTNIRSDDVRRVIDEIKQNCNLPAIVFPNSADALAPNADYVFFITPLNSEKLIDTRNKQLEGVSLIKEWQIKSISVGYVIISTGYIVTQVERALFPLKKLTNEDREEIVKYALLAENRNCHYIYTEAGSGAENPVSVEVIKEIKKNTKIPLIVGGGIRSASTAEKILNAGADVIVIGTGAEENLEIIKKIGQVVKKKI